MARVVVGLVTCVAVWFGGTSAAWAQDSVAVSATVSGGQVVAQVTGAADPCSYCSSQAVQVEADPITDGSTTACWPSAPQVSIPISTDGGNFSFSPSISVSGGQQYEVCAFIVQNSYGSNLPVAESQPVVVTVPPGPCPSGTGHALILDAPRSVPRNLEGLIDVSENQNSLQDISSATLTMQELAAQTPFYSYVFTPADLNQLNGYNDVQFSIGFTRRDGPARVAVDYTQTESGASDARCIDQLTALVRPARPTTPQVPIDSGANPTAGLQRKPWRIVYSGDGSALLSGRHGIGSHLKWTIWNTTQGRAQGNDWHDNCTPDCASGTYSSYPVNIHVYRARVVDRYLMFTRMTVTYTGARPPYPAYRHGSVTYKLDYDSQFNVFFWA